MCLSKYSNLDLLKEVAMNLCPSEDHRNINNLRERELAGLINTFYQSLGFEVTSSLEKRKSEVNGSSDNMKLKVEHKVPFFLSALELLPNEVYEIILKYLGGEDKKNMRITSKGIYHKTTLMAPMFQYWCFEADKGTQPDFVLQTGKNFHISFLSNNSSIGPSYNLINFAPRITSIQIDLTGVILNQLNMNPAQFLHLTSLDLENVSFNNNSLLILAPQLENLRLVSIENDFDISSVDENSTVFQKLKALTLWDIKIDMNKILMKCCKTLEYFELTHDLLFNSIANLQHELSSMKNLSISLSDEYGVIDDSTDWIRSLISQCSGSLRTLKLDVTTFDSEIDLCSLVDQTMKITTLVMHPTEHTNVKGLLSKCPLIQNLSLILSNFEVHEVCLKDLINLRLIDCFQVSSVVNNILKTSKSSVKTLYLKTDDLIDFELSEIPELDTVWCSRKELYSEESDVILKMFPKKSKVITTEEPNGTVFRRVYDLP